MKCVQKLPNQNTDTILLKTCTLYSVYGACTLLKLLCDILPRFSGKNDVYEKTNLPMKKTNALFSSRFKGFKKVSDFSEAKLIYPYS